MLPVLIVVLVIVVVVAVVLARRGASRASSRVEGRLAALDVQQQAKADLYGLTSGGPRQARAPGQLVLTPDSLVFIQFVPEREVTIPRAEVTDVELAPTFLDKTPGRELLVVSWEGADGADQAAWDVPEPAAWRAAIRE